jgi:phage terminase large subunit-like protein
MTCPRKQGKSTLGAALALYMLYADGEGGAEIFSAAGSADQAAIIFDIAAKMVAQSPALRDMTMVYRRELVVPSLGARYKVISAEAGTAHGLDLSACIIDELHVWPDDKLYVALTTASGARKQPLTFIATTAGSDEHSICAEVHRRAEQVRDGIVEDPTLLPVIFAAPEDADWQDEAVWRACNPALGKFRELDEMRAAARLAREVPGREASFRQLYLNQWGAAAAARWLPLPAWDACRAEPPEPIAGRRAFLGLDLSATTDLSALVVIIPDGEGGYDVRADFWAPRENMAKRAQADRVPYPLWAEQGYLTPTEGGIVDYDAIGARIHALMREYEVVQIGADPWNARGFLAKLAADNVPVVEVPQTMANLTSASKELEKLVLSAKIRHDGHPILRWCVANTVADVDGNGNVKPSKKRSPERIDGVSALVTGLSRAMVAVQYRSVYETRGVITA